MKHAFPPSHAPAEPVGIGLRAAHYEEILGTDLNIGWIEVHPENYFGLTSPEGYVTAGGGVHRHFLSQAREKFQLSLHAVGLSLGSDQPVDARHLAQFKELIDLYDPFHISDHASWSISGNAHLNDLLPLPYRADVLDRLARNVAEAQDYFGRPMLIENPSTYVNFADNEMAEHEFMNKLSAMTGCSLLLDINNIYVQAVNHGFDAFDYIDQIDASRVREMHLAGHIEQPTQTRPILVDTHNQPVRTEVWDLYAHAVRRFGAIPTLIEWDADVPTLEVLVAEADKARAIIADITGDADESVAVSV